MRPGSSWGYRHGPGSGHGAAHRRNKPPGPPDGFITMYVSWQEAGLQQPSVLRPML